MSTFEQIWYDKYMNNYCTASTLIKLANAEKLEQIFVDALITERLEKYGY